MSNTNTKGMLIDYTPGIEPYEYGQGIAPLRSQGEMAYEFGKMAFQNAPHLGFPHDENLTRWLVDVVRPSLAGTSREPDYRTIGDEWCRGWNEAKNASSLRFALADQFCTKRI